MFTLQPRCPAAEGTSLLLCDIGDPGAGRHGAACGKQGGPDLACPSVPHTSPQKHFIQTELTVGKEALLVKRELKLERGHRE